MCRCGSLSEINGIVSGYATNIEELKKPIIITLEKKELGSDHT